MTIDLTETQLNTLYSGLIAAEAYAKKVGAESYLEEVLDARQALINQEGVELGCYLSKKGRG